MYEIAIRERKLQKKGGKGRFKLAVLRLVPTAKYCSQ